MATRVAQVGAAERALERLFRLTANRSMHKRQTAAVGVDVARAGYAVLRSLDEAGELNLGDIARECSMDPGATSRQVRVLEDDGLVERATDDTDARAVVLRLTDQGRDVYRRIVAVRTTYMGAVLDGWSVEDCATLARLVDRLVDDLKAAPFRPTTGQGAHA